MGTRCWGQHLPYCSGNATGGEHQLTRLAGDDGDGPVKPTSMGVASGGGIVVS